MEIIKEVLIYAPEIIDLMGVIILLIGFVRGVIEFFKMEISRFKGKGNQFRTMQILRCDVGLYILLALDFIITSDIITSMVHTDMDDLINLGAIVVLRTVIGYFLGKEIEEVHNDAAKGEKIENNDN